MNNNELYHYGVLGMKWGRRKTRSINKISKKSNSKNKKQKETKTFYSEKKKAATMIAIGAGSVAASLALSKISSYTYNNFKNNGTPLHAKIVNGSHIASEALSTIGLIGIGTGTVKHITSYNYK